MSATDIASVVSSSIATAASSGTLAATISTIAASPDDFFSYDFSSLLSYSYDSRSSAFASATVTGVSTTVVVVSHASMLTPTPTVVTTTDDLVIDVSMSAGRASMVAPVLAMFVTAALAALLG